MCPFLCKNSPLHHPSTSRHTYCYCIVYSFIPTSTDISFTFGDFQLIHFFSILHVPPLGKQIYWFLQMKVLIMMPLSNTFNQLWLALLNCIQSAMFPFLICKRYGIVSFLMINGGVYHLKYHSWKECHTLNIAIMMKSNTRYNFRENNIILHCTLRKFERTHNNWTLCNLTDYFKSLFYPPRIPSIGLLKKENLLNLFCR